MTTLRRLPTKPTSPTALLLSAVLALMLAGCGSHGKAEDGPEKASAAGEAGAQEGGSREAAMLNLETFVVNLADLGGGRYAKCTLKIELNSRNALEAIQSDEVMIPKMRDRILTLLSSRTADSLMTPQGKEQLKRDVQARVGPLLKAGKIKDVYITDFLIQ